MCFQKREFFDLDDPEFDDEVLMDPLPGLIIFLPLDQDLVNWVDMQDFTENTSPIRYRQLFNLARNIKMMLKDLVIRLLQATFIVLLLLFVLPEKSSVVFINPAQIIPSNTGCPDDTKCSVACQDDPRFNTDGSCVGPDRMLCSCRPPPDNTTDLPMNADSKACHDEECERKCAKYGVPMAGKCTEGVCKCGYNVTMAGCLSTEVIPSKCCLLSSCPIMSLGFEWYDGKVSAIFNWRNRLRALLLMRRWTADRDAERNASTDCDDSLNDTNTSTRNMTF